MSVAYCRRTGKIEIGRACPAGALPLARGGAVALRRAVEAKSRHAYDGKTLLVPGIPEAETDIAAMAAARQFSAWLTKGEAKLAPALTPMVEG